MYCVILTKPNITFFPNIKARVTAVKKICIFPVRTEPELVNASVLLLLGNIKTISYLYIELFQP